MTRALILLIGLPIALVRVGWPLPQPVPLSQGQLVELFQMPMTGTRLLKLAACVGWVIWLILLYAAAVEIGGRLSNTRLPRLQLPAPLQLAAAGLVGATALPAAAVASPGHQSVAVATATPNVSTTPPVKIVKGRADQTVTFVVRGQRYHAIVRKRDTLSKIAKLWLGDANRWPEICALNRHRHFERVGGTLRDCDLIYPGWDLRLPHDAVAPPGARMAGASTTRPSPPAVVPAPITPAQPSPASSTPPTNTHEQADQTGVTLPDGSWIPWALAASLTAAAAMIWLQRRRRYVPGDPVDDDLPQPIRQIRRQVLSLPRVEEPAEDAHAPGAAPIEVAPRASGTGLVGEGAYAAARAAIVAALASDAATNAQHRSEVLIDGATHSLLFEGEDANAQLPQLRVVENTEQALTAMETELLRRSRLLDEQSAGIADVPQEKASGTAVVTALLLVMQAPSEGAALRTRACASLGVELNVSTLLVGEWVHGTTLHIGVDGHVTDGAAGMDPARPDRLAVMSLDAAVAAMVALREAQTGESPSPTPGHPRSQTPRIHHSSTTVHEPSIAKAQLRMLGAVEIPDASRPVRAKALELAVLLACHPDGLSTRDIGEHLEPDARLSQSDQRVHTNASNLRLALARPGFDGKHYLIKTGGRYRLNPATVDVDLWKFYELVSAAKRSDGEARVALLREAVDLSHGPLAGDHAYDWIMPHRESARRSLIDVHVMLAELLLTADPDGASDVLTDSIAIDPYNEELYRRAMRARHGLGDADGVRQLLRALQANLRDLDAEPTPETQALVAQLLQDRKR
ncbi:DNA-binding SARP family transcriptional activator [Hamadaea flava]|uniref:BTAD domain-containing putative transcriptional regulator n=1 Tax=Hamadaea flava TaxID=1742688 RepID=A0ABV8LDS7_9ACTN|nr:BTAD domain-containing putative transcriptional regulator [Hamadaea flava]MCP2323389.1 DNA-binding SARP family transcriptional activator [Hamadaea flava]